MLGSKTIVDTVLPKSIPPVNSASSFTLIVVPEVIVPLAEGIIIIARAKSSDPADIVPLFSIVALLWAAFVASSLSPIVMAWWFSALAEIVP